MEISPGSISPSGSADLRMQALLQLAQIKPGDILSGRAIRPAPAGVVVNIQGIEIVLPIAGLSPGTQLLLEVQSATDGLLFELLSRNETPAANRTFLPPVYSDPAPAAPSSGVESQATARARPAQAGHGTYQLSDEAFQAVASKFKINPAPEVKATVEALLQYRLPVNEKNLQEVLHLGARSAWQSGCGLGGENSTARAVELTADILTRPASQKAPPAQTQQIEPYIRAAALAKAAGFPASPHLVAAIREIVAQTPKLQESINSLQRQLETIGSRDDFRSIDPAGARLLEASGKLEKVFLSLEQLRQSQPGVLRSLSVESIRAFHDVQVQIQQTVEKVLANNQVLRQLDIIISAIESEIPSRAGALSQAEISPVVIRQLDALINLPPGQLKGEIVQFIEQVQAGPPRVDMPDILRQLAVKAGEFERLELERNALITELRSSHSEVRGLIDRFHAVRMLNFTPQATEHNVLFAEIPLRAGKQKSTALFKVMKRKRKDKKKRPDEMLTIAISLETEKLAEVRGILSWLAGQLALKFQVVNEKIRQLFSSGRESLRERLEAMGFTCDINVEVRKTEPPDISAGLFDEFQDIDAGSGGLDLKV
ncbi:hypothetical protein ACFL54_04445 [Planctomycetota bacterium]